MSARHVAAVDHLPRRWAYDGCPQRCRIVIVPLDRLRQRVLHSPPVPLLEAVEAVDRSRGTGIHAAVERLVAPSRLLLPGAAREALDDAGHQPLGGELLEVLLAVLREVAGPGRIARTFVERLVRGPLQLEPTVQLALGDRRADRPDPQPAPLATSIGLRDREQQRRVLVATLDRDRGAR